VVAITDTNCDPDIIDYIVPGNDDAIRAIKLFVAHIADACLEGDARNKDMDAVKAQEQAAEKQAEATEPAEAAAEIPAEAPEAAVEASEAE